MSRSKKKDFNNIVIMFAILLIISSIPKRAWINVFFILLFTLELVFLIIFIAIWLKNYLIKTKEICSEIEEIDKMSGIEFENYIKDLYIKLGYNATTTANSHDYGADIIATKNNTKICIQTKRYNKNRNVNIRAVQEVIGSLNYYNANEGIVITTSNFTKSALKLSAKNNIILIGRSELQSLILKSSKSDHPYLLKFINFISEP